MPPQYSRRALRKRKNASRTRSPPRSNRSKPRKKQAVENEYKVKGGTSFNYGFVEIGYMFHINFMVKGYFLEYDMGSRDFKDAGLETDNWMVTAGYNYRYGLGKSVYIQGPPASATPIRKSPSKAAGMKIRREEPSSRCARPWVCAYGNRCRSKRVTAGTSPNSNSPRSTRATISTSVSTSDFNRLPTMRFALLIAATAIVSAVQVQPHVGMTEKGSSASYRYTLDGKDVGAYPRLEVDAAVTTDEGLEVSYLFNLYDKKGKIHKGAKMMGFGEGLLYAVKYTDGAYYLTQDLIFAQADDRMGYLLKMPAALEVGQEIEGGTFSSSAKVPIVGTLRTEITLSGMRVVEQREVTLKSGQTLRCYVVEGNVDGEASKTRQNGRIIFHFAPGIGIVREEIVEYLDQKKSYAAELTEFRRPE